MSLICLFCLIFAGPLDREACVCPCLAFTKAGNSSVCNIWRNCVLGCCGRHLEQTGDLLETLMVPVENILNYKQGDATCVITQATSCRILIWYILKKIALYTK
jgi:hypothetical protein